MQGIKSMMAALAVSGVVLTAPVLAAPLPALVIDPNEISVSGLSSGGFMAVQLHVAYSATFKRGAGIVAGGPFYCAEGSITNATGRCMTHSTSIPVSSLVSTTNSWASSSLIDPVANLNNSKVYLFSGSIDSTVKQAVMDDLKTYYASFVPTANTFYKNNIAAEHAMITDSYGSSCSTKGSPYINNCNFDLAGEILKWLYGTLNPRNTGTLGGTLLQFDQTEFVTNHGMDTTGWAYIPAACSSGATCKLHVVLHGCQQNQTLVGDKYYKNTGYNAWADTNNIVLLYPQTSTQATNSCWDWWGYDNANYAKKSGPQMAAIKAMITKVSSGTAGSGLAAPTNLAASNATANSMQLTWTGVSGAAGYNVYRGSTKVNSALVTGTSYTDSGLAASTSYTWTVKAVTSAGAESPASSAVSATTSAASGGAPAAPTGVTAGSPTSSSMVISWTAVSGASGYNVYRGSTKVNSALVTTTSFTDTGLAAATNYSWTVKAVNSSGTESAASSAASGTTSAAATCYTASNYAHVTAGRAYVSLGYALANGSNQNMGLYNTFYTTTLKMTGTNYYVIGTCP
jgi:poly(3-hydroxybutyrate) depolymerase